MIAAGLGFGPLPVHYAKDLVKRGKLWRLPPFENTLVVDVHLVHHHTARLGRAEHALLDLFRHRVQSTPLDQRSDDPVATE